MAMSLGLLAGIIAGGVGLTSFTVFLVVLGLRRKHKRLLSQINSAGERRLSGFRASPSAIMSITDEDVARMPGTRASVRHSLHTPYNRNSLYTPMASRETLPRRACNPKTRADDRNDHEPVAQQQSWPLPRRMTRADGTPLVRLPLSTLTPVTERSKSALASPPPEKIGNPAGMQEHERVSSDILHLNGENDDAHTASTPTTLTPKPLFHGQQRSCSQGMIAGLTDGSKTEPRASRRTSLFPRSKSMYSQEPGTAPLQPLPPLPLEITSKTIARARSPGQSTRRASGGSLFSEQTSILDDNWSKAFSQVGTNLKTITLPSLRIPALTPQSLGQDQGVHVIWNSSFEEGRASPMGAAKQTLFRPQLSTKRSFRASIEESLPRSKSSGLSLSMSLHGPSRAESRTSLAIDPASPHSKARVDSSRSTEKKRPKPGTPSSSPLCRAPDFTIHDDTNSKRASTSTLHENEGSPMPSLWDKRPRSIATSRPQDWDSESLSAAKPSASKYEGGGRERHNRVQTANIPVLAPSPAIPPAIDEQEGLPPETPQLHQQTRKGRLKQITFRPPSRQDFDFNPQTDLRRAKSRRANNASPFSPTLSMINLYPEDESTPDSELDTPTRKPSTRRPFSAHANVLKTIFDHPTPTVWPLSTAPPPDRQPDPEKPKSPSRQTGLPSPTPSSRPTSFLLNFPWPQPPTTTRTPKTPLRGPRPPPSRHLSPHKSTSHRRRSPIRTGNNGVAKQHQHRTGSPGKDLRRSVAALRRMNSEVASISGGRRSREHRRYLSIGEEGEGDAGLDDGDGGSRRGSRILFFANDGGRRRAADGKENLVGPREMRVWGGMAKLGPSPPPPPSGNGGNDRVKKSPSGSIYDRDGFLKELDA